MLDKPIITLTTDFGVKDPFVGIMKGIIYEINPKANVIDLSHDITPHNVLEASRVILMAHKYFPPATIHVAVVDPQVGGLRNPLLVVTDNYYFIGPDNGIFSHIIDEEHPGSILKVIKISATHYFRSLSGSTFHGRDIFAPAAAWLSKGVDSSKFGEPLYEYVTLQTPKFRLINEKTIEGEVIYIDVFGNAITNITKENLDNLSPEFSAEKFRVIYKDKKLNISNYYSETESTNLSGIINSFEFLELFTYKVNASEKFGIKIGDKVSVVVV